MKHGEMKESEMKKMKVGGAMMKPMHEAKEMKAKHESEHGAPRKARKTKKRGKK